MNRLITFGPSHYCEKARWALTHGDVAFREESHVPVFSWAATFGAGAGRTVPALITPTEVVADSTDILRWVDRQPGVRPLFPAETPEVAELEDEFDRHLGPATRLFAYFQLSAEEALLRKMLRSAAHDGWEARLMGPSFPIIRFTIFRGLGVNAPNAERARRVIEESFDRVGRRLSDGRHFLTGDHFTAADLTFAALAYLVVWPSQCHALAIGFDELPASVRTMMEERRATPAGRFALRVWEEERRR